MNSLLANSEIDSLYRNNIIIDGQSFLEFPTSKMKPVKEEALQAMVSSGITAINNTVYSARKSEFSSFETAIRSLIHWNDIITKHTKLFRQGLKTADIKIAKENGQLAVFQGIQNGEPLDDDVSRIDVFYKLGVRIIQLTYNLRNRLGDGCLERSDGGLSHFGIACVERMNEVGILIDISHVGIRSSMDTIEVSTRPVAITHSNCFALLNNKRCKSDDVIVRLAKRDGVMGVSFVNFFVSNKAQSTVDDAIDHIDYLVKLIGIDHVAVGSDVPMLGFASVYPDEDSFWRSEGDYVRKTRSDYLRYPCWIEGLDGPEKLRTLLDGLIKRGYSPDNVRQILGGNWLRLFEQTIG